MKRGINKKMATFCQITPQHLSDILSRRKNPSAKLAVILEKYTSVSRAIWIWGSREDLREALEAAFREPMQGEILQETSEL